jgi:anoctamin-8
MIVLVVAIMMFSLHTMDTARVIHGTHSFLQYWPIVAYSFVPAISGYLFDQIVVFLNDFEDHPPEQEESALITKQFIFQFINRYCALIYAAFYLRDMERLRILLASLLITNAVSQSLSISAPLLSLHSPLPHGFLVVARSFWRTSWKSSLPLS